MNKHLFEAALSYKNNGQFPEAEEYCQRVLKDNPNHGQTHQLLASIYHMQDKHDAAIASLQNAITLNPAGPDTAEFYTNLGNLFMRARRTAEGAQAYQQALMFDPHYITALYNCAIMADGQQKTDEAIGYYQRIIAVDSSHALAHNNLGALYFNSERLDEARRHFLKALDSKPDYANALNNLGLIAMRTSSTIQEALPYLQRATTLYPNNVQFACNLTLYYARSGQIKDAIQHFQNTASMHPDKESWKILLGTLYYMSTHPECSDRIKMMLKSLVVSPSQLKKLYISFALFAYANHHLEECRYYLKHGNEVTEEAGAENDRDIQWVRAFALYISSLLAYQEQHPQYYNGTGKPFYVVGESHCLAPAHTSVTYKEKPFLMVPKIITGCKIWHLISPQPNQFKNFFGDIISTLPKKSPLLLTIGEIDCRSDEGILPYAITHPDIDLAAHITRMADDYIAFVRAQTADRQLELFIQGVPAPNCAMDALSAHDKDLLVQITRLWNDALRAATEAAGLHFIDVYRLTATDKGISNKQHHIDDYHLIPHYLQGLLDT